MVGLSSMVMDLHRMRPRNHMRLRPMFTTALKEVLLLPQDDGLLRQWHSGARRNTSHGGHVQEIETISPRARKSTIRPERASRWSSAERDGRVRRESRMTRSGAPSSRLHYANERSELDQICEVKSSGDN